MSTPVISIVSPVYQSADNVAVLVQRIHAALAPLGKGFEVILVEDGSTDNSWEMISVVAVTDTVVHGLRLARNYGQHTAIRAGLAHAKGELIVVMDCDLQDPPEDIPRLINALTADMDAVFAERMKTYNTAFQRTLTHGFYRCLSFISRVPMDGAVANFGVYSAHVVRYMLQDTSAFFFLPLAARKYAKHTTTIPVAHAQRHAGVSGYSLLKAAGLAWRVIIAQSFFANLLIRSNRHYQIREVTTQAYDTLQ